MGWGVLQDAKMAAPPGTATIGANDAAAEAADDYKMKRDGNIILQPQPSDSPNDPLNWSPVWKETIMVILAFNSGVTTSLGPMITPGLKVIATEYNVSIDQVSSFMIGFLAFWIGFTTFFTASGANIWGKRPFFVIGTVLLLASNIWGYFATSFNSLAIMRVLQGIASAPLETLVTSTVSDLYFVHQRGTRLSIWGTMLASGVLLGQTISGTIIQNLGVAATFGISALIYVPLLFLTFFFIVETTYSKPREETDIKGEDKGSFWSETEVDDKESYVSQLRLFKGRLSSESYWKGVVKPLPLIAYPAVLFSTLVYGSYFTWLLTISVLAVDIFQAPPYNLNPAQVGLTNLPLLVVAVAGSPVSGWMADKVAKSMARRNRGVFEPEFRLTLMIVALPLATVGFLGFGMAAQNGAPLYWLLTFMSIHALSVPFATQASLTYVIDCHPKDANQAFVTINFTKAVFTFLATTYANQWFFAVGPRTVFVSIALINLALSSLTIPAYVFGKRFRSMVARSRLNQKISQ